MFDGDTYFRLGHDEEGTSFVDADNEVLVVALDASEDVVLIYEPSPAFGEPVLILPGGTEEPDESHEETANRELQEEVGLRSGRLDFLGEVRPWSKYLHVRSFIYLARDLTESSLKGDENYAIETVSMPLADIMQLVSERRIVDARVIAALLLAQHFLSAASQ